MNMVRSVTRVNAACERNALPVALDREGITVLIELYNNSTMRRAAFNTVCRTRTSVEAERLIGLLRNAALHPVDLPLTAPLALADSHPTFPVQVPSEEEEAARQVLQLTSEEAA